MIPISLYRLMPFEPNDFTRCHDTGPGALVLGFFRGWG